MSCSPRRVFLITIFLLGISTAALASDFQVAGMVVNAIDGSPVARCQVLIKPDPFGDPRTMSKPMTVITAEDGRFLFSGVAEGKYTMIARRNGFRVQPLNENEGLTSAVVVGPGKDSQNIIFRVQPSASITGRVEDEFGDPVANAQVSIFRRAPLQGKTIAYPRGRTAANDEGVYHFYRQPPGEYFLVVVGRPWYTQFAPYHNSLNDDSSARKLEDGDADLDVAFPLTYYPGTVDVANAMPVRLHPGERFVADIKLNSVPASHFATAKPAPEGSSRVEQSLATTVFSVEMNMDPALRIMRNDKTTDFTGVPPGHYILRHIRPATETPSDEMQQEIDVSSANRVEFRKTTEGTPVTGKIVLEGIDEPLRETMINFDKGDGHILAQAHSTPNGELAPFKLFPGQYFYSAISKQAVIKSFQASGAKVIGRTIEVGTSPVSLTVTMADVAVVIEGTVRSRDGKPICGALVVAIPEDPEHNHNIFRRDQTDTDGAYMLKVVMPGKYMLVAIEDAGDLEWSNVDVMRRFFARGESIQVLPGSDITANIVAQSAKE
ncbi:MAG: hypothetical protein JWO13_2784 [Acidobacteriales bacterium]|nr:hypothetical protein [Terriglobales bacterium]